MKRICAFISPALMILISEISFGQDLKMIQEEAEKKWPGKPEMVEFTVKNEKEAFAELAKFSPDKVVSAEDLKLLRDVAENKWPKLYSMQAFHIKEEIKAGHELAEYSAPKGMPDKVFDAIWKRKSEKWGQWSMRIYAIKEEVKAWQALQSLPKEKVAKAAKKWPEDFSMQLYSAKKDL